MSSPFADCRSCTCSALRRASRAVTQHYEAAFRGSGLRATQFTVLAMLEQSGPMAMTPLASRLGMDRTTLTRTLKPLEQRGLIKFEDDKKDQRIRNIVITPQGIEAALAALPRWEKAQVSAGVLLDRLGIEMHR